MLTIIGAIIGLLGSMGPNLLNFFTAKQNNDYQLKVIQLQMQAAAQGAELKLEAQQSEDEVKMQQALYSYENGPSGSPFIDALKASVRPVITYAFFFLWALVEFVGFFYALHQGKPILDIVKIIWDPNTQAIFVTIIAFWFGSRVMEKVGMFPPINQPKVQVSKHV